MSAPTIYVELDCELDSAHVSIRSTGRTIVVEVPDVETGFRLIRFGPSRSSLRRKLARLKELLDVLLLSIEVRIAGRSVLRIGHETGTAFWSVFGFPSLSFSAHEALRAWAVAEDRRTKH